MPLTQDLLRAKEYREANPSLADLSDQDLASIVNKETGELGDLAKSSALGRTIGRGSNMFNVAGQDTESFLSKHLGGSFPARVGARAASMAVSSAPEFMINALASRVAPQSKLGAIGLGALNFGLGAARSAVETGDTKAAVGAGAGNVVSLLGALAGGAKGRALGGSAGGFLGSTLGALPGQGVAIASAPGGLESFLKDPVNLPATLLSQLPYGAIDHISERGQAAKFEREKKIAETPSLEDYSNTTPAQEYVNLNKIPVSQLTEQAAARIRELAINLGNSEEKKLAEAKNAAGQVDPATMPESDATIFHQIGLMNRGKKAATFIPKGAEVPTVPFHLQGYLSHDNDAGHWLYNPDMTNPQAIDDAVKTDTVGNLLGYGTPNKPANPSGFAAVIRDRNGVEKMGAVLGLDNETQVMEHFKTLMDPGDVLKREPITETLAKRQNDQGTIKHYSLDSGENPEYVEQSKEFFKNTLLDRLNKSLTPTASKGARFQPDANGDVGTKGVRDAIEQWVPKEMFEHYKEAGLDDFLKTSRGKADMTEYSSLAAKMKQLETNPDDPAFGEAWQKLEAVRNRHGGVPPSEKTLSSINKVNVEQLSQWIRENTPNIEVKKLEPVNTSKQNVEAAQAQHRLESQGFQVQRSEEDGHLVILEPQAYGGKDVSMVEKLHKDYGEQTKRDIMTMLSKEGLFEDQSDAATGRYGVEPINVSEMDRPVDILVRAPIKTHTFDTPNDAWKAGKEVTSIGPGREAKAKDKLLFQGPHFGESDKNVLASVRGYMVGDTFYAFEVQSDWGQQQAKERKTVDRLNAEEARQGVVSNNQQSREKYLKTFNHPLLESYETLALKTAIQHALENGATRIAISDGPTAMMIEGHDQQYREGPNGPVFKVLQESGMRAAYDERLPTIAKRLTGDKGQRVDLGEFTARDASSYFNGKKNITARAYDLNNLKPEVQNLFSLYGQQEQHDFQQSLQKAESTIEKAIAAGQDVTHEQFLDEVLKGNSIDKAVALKYLNDLKGPLSIRTFESDAVNGIKPKGRTTAQEVAINTKQSGESAFRTASHEFSHTALNQLKYANPEAFKDAVSFPTEHMNSDQRKSILEQVFKQAKIEGADLDYLSGSKFDPKDPNIKTKQAYEFYGALSEVLAKQVYDSSTIHPRVSEWFSWLPMGAQRWLSQLSGQFTKFFGPQYPSLRHMLTDDQQSALAGAYDKLLRFSHSNEAAQARAYQQLKRTDLFNQDQFIDKIPTRYDTSDWKPAMQALSGKGEFTSWSLNFLRDSGLVTKVKDAYEDNFMSPLFRTKLHPETLDFFRELHHYRNNIKTYEHGYLEFLGQNKGGTLSSEQAIKSYHDYIQTLISPFDKTRNVRLEKMSKIIGRNQEIRDSLLNPTNGKKPVGSVNADQLVTREQMTKEYGLSDTDADFLQKLIKLPTMVAQQSLKFMQQTDSTNLSKLFYLQNKSQDINEVKAKTAELTRVANDAGAQIYERKAYEKYLSQMRSNPDSDPRVVAELENRVYQLKQQEGQFGQLMDASIRQAFAGKIPFGAPGEDAFIPQVSAVAFRLAEARAEHQFIMRDEGYAPMTRRGRFLVQEFKRDFDGAALPGSVAKMSGFKTKKEAADYMAKNKLTQENSALMDKEDFAARAQLYTSRQLQAVRDKARSDLGELIRSYSDRLPDSPQLPDQLKVLNDIMGGFRPLDQEIKEVVSAKGDKFRERRYNVAGFNENDFIPNIFEYSNYKTIIGQKSLTRAEAELQTLRPTVQSDPAMVGRMQREMDYVLSHTNEAAGLRKFVFYNYLGASVRHMFQNLLQVPLNGIPEMMAQGGGMHSYGHAVKAGKLAFDYLKSGTTGNKTFDVLLKQAEKEGITIPNAIEFFAPESGDLQNALDSISGQENGTLNVGEKAKFASSQLFKGFEKFMRSTAVASEQTNRRVSFLMSLLESERTGVKDPKAMFNKANVFTDYVNFVGDKSNRPGFQVKLGQTWAHAPVLVATAMQSFVMNHISQLYAYGKLAMKGDVQYQKAFATGTLHLLAMAGTMGLPLAQNSEQLFEAVTGLSLKEALRRKLILGAKDMFDMQESNGGRIADLVLNGLPKMLGIEASGSIGLGDPLFHVQAGQEPSALDFAGPVGGIIQKGLAGASAVSADPWSPDSWLTATRTVAPQALNYWLRLADATMKGGYYDRKGAPVVDNLNANSSVSLLGGFTPTEVQNVRDVGTARRKIDDHLSSNYQNAVELTAKALLDFETSGNPTSLTTANEQFSKYLNTVAGTQDRGTMVHSVSERLQQLKSPTFQPPTLKESRPFQEALSSYPGTKYPYAEKIPLLVDELKVAQSLGQQDVLMQKIQGLSVSLMQKALYDQLVATGYEPSQAALLSQGGKSAAQKLMRLSPAVGGSGHTGP